MDVVLICGIVVGVGVGNAAAYACGFRDWRAIVCSFVISVPLLYWLASRHV